MKTKSMKGIRKLLFVISTLAFVVFSGFAYAKNDDARAKSSKTEKATTPPKKPAGKDVVTANGQKAAPNGTRLGPSGKPEYHYSNSATKKQAVDGAKAQGSGRLAKDKATAKQPEHLHAVDKKGDRVSGPDKTHFNVRGAKPKAN